MISSLCPVWSMLTKISLFLPKEGVFYRGQYYLHLGSHCCRGARGTVRGLSCEVCSQQRYWHTCYAEGRRRYFQRCDGVSEPTVSYNCDPLHFCRHHCCVGARLAGS